MKTILLIDDERAMLTAFGMGLRQAGYHVLEADSGRAGIELARRFLPDLILTDINMPGGDGTTLLREIRQDPELQFKQVVLMTGRPDLVPPRRGMEAGADDFLVKPITLEALLSCVQARFDRAAVSWRVEDRMLAQWRASVPPNLPHEFFTPMAGIIGLMEILESGYEKFSPEEVKDIHRDVYQSALRLNRTLRNYLLILELQGKPAEKAGRPSSPSETETAVLAGIEEALRKNNRRGDVKAVVQGAALAVRAQDLSLVVEELVDNACKFSRQGTPVTVGFAEGRLMVTDLGRGMTPEEIARIGAFHQFERKRQEQQGLGLGLVLVQNLVARADGKFSLESEPGAGSRAQIEFPLAS